MGLQTLRFRAIAEVIHYYEHENYFECRVNELNEILVRNIWSLSALLHLTRPVIVVQHFAIVSMNESTSRRVSRIWELVNSFMMCLFVRSLFYLDVLWLWLWRPYKFYIKFTSNCGMILMLCFFQTKLIYLLKFHKLKPLKNSTAIEKRRTKIILRLY